MSLLVELQECPRCGGTIPRQDLVRQELPDRVDWYCLCEFCGAGIELSEYPDGTIFPLTYHARTEPDCFAKFLQRLAEARVA